MLPPFAKIIAKLYFWWKTFRKRDWIVQARGAGRGKRWDPFFKKMTFLANIERCRKFLEYALNSGYHYCTTTYNKVWTSLCTDLYGVVDIVRSMTMVLAGYKAKQLLLVNHTTKIIHHYHRLVIVAKGFLKLACANKTTGSITFQKLDF